MKLKATFPNRFPIAKWILSRLAPTSEAEIPFTNSSEYWDDRYKAGGTSGSGSYGKLAKFKAEVLNSLVREFEIGSVIEFGCGDGNQLTLSNYPRYMGVDISAQSILLCRSKFVGDNTKTFKTLDSFNKEASDLCLSLDVIYHLVEDGVYEDYMARLFQTAQKLVVIYSSNVDRMMPAPHVRHRKFSNWIDENASAWSQVRHIPNRYAKDFEPQLHADFFVFAKR